LEHASPAGVVRRPRFAILLGEGPISLNELDGVERQNSLSDKRLEINRTDRRVSSELNALKVIL
jgi:hypothetical protein